MHPSEGTARFANSSLHENGLCITNGSTRVLAPKRGTDCSRKRTVASRSWATCPFSATKPPSDLSSAKSRMRTSINREPSCRCLSGWAWSCMTFLKRRVYIFAFELSDFYICQQDAILHLDISFWDKGTVKDDEMIISLGKTPIVISDIYSWIVAASAEWMMQCFRMMAWESHVLWPNTFTLYAEFCNQRARFLLTMMRHWVSRKFHFALWKPWR